MWRFFLVVVIAGLFLVLFFGNDNCAYAGCKAYASCSADDDYGSNPLCQDGPYTPCNWIVKWYISFHRTMNTNGSTTLQYSLAGCNLLFNFDSQDYAAGQDHECWGYEDCEPSGTHTLRLLKNGQGGHFTDIFVSATYYASKPEGGEE
ncbi:MAG: hypothetical protein B6D58_05200 [candidate division Zixibacteria bacterium 4484_95]|nr:MAG: hypothetical protein B6D58_05200 [candidate division Zixibacteria bacterium 4484_95]RKX18742.1 MAG: hypothetical protein DRP26_04660 [candidate division Zixibacteria bacterium]